jgi:nucleoid DNA-binding protein
MEVNMTNAELIKILSLRLEQSQVETKRLLKSSAEIMKDILDKDVGITIPGLGTFFTHVRNKRKSFNPYHKKLMMLPKKRIIKFHSSSTINDELKFKRLENE